MTSWERPPGPEPEVPLTPEQAARLDPDALFALRYGAPPPRSSPGGRRGCRLLIVLMGVGAFVGIAILGAMLGQLRTTSAGAPDTRAKTTLAATATAAQGIAGATNSFLSADPAALQSAIADTTFVEGAQPSTSNRTVSVRHEPTIFIAAAAGKEGSCWFARASTDPVLAGVNWNRTTGGAPCKAHAAPIDGWTTAPPA